MKNIQNTKCMNVIFFSIQNFHTSEEVVKQFLIARGIDQNTANILDGKYWYF